MIYVTGDMHADIDINKFSSGKFPQGKTLTKDDYVIVCGDFGLCWDGSSRETWWRKWLSSKPWTTLFVDGNHENFDMLFQLPEREMFGNRVREVAPSIFYLPRGEVFTIEDKTFFTFGGARSHDREYRKENVSWWPQEMPTYQEMCHGIDSLDDVDWKVDYVLTHCAPTDVQSKIRSWYESDDLTQFFNRVYPDLSFRKWFFGHYHVDQTLDDGFACLYHDIKRIA
ncbi:MAG: metallophosphoesterase [Clostridia bacterium]|nr:metallophosphoesterase [Clostridia bacterium]